LLVAVVVVAAVVAGGCCDDSASARGLPSFDLEPGKILNDILKFCQGYFLVEIEFIVKN